ncbi:menaquinone biosynthesis family protein [Albibacterium bauzanense]|uniref:1,4-dihydroxy-6-naphtoate synthase n=1 Tax=Albibacterium bauzanense TaxID=653929 RepID=A0A4R1M0E7_9SPHI|nr:1,4-dihydroxy-6-naphthoate synthase [Albibacterium bauzanense]TCK82999.1 1,4-dihydroxy-6-naphthoate synthase [Albibacterium bauzanense]
MKLSLGFSPCPNDTFIFDALIHKKIDTEGIDFDVFFDDVETLNKKVFKNEPDISKLSFHAFAYAVENYALLDAGSALGHGVGPLLISSDKKLTDKEYINQHKDLTVGIPGEFTTANFLLGLAFPVLKNKKILVFSEIESALLNNSIDLGLIIHENRFTYQDKGLHKIIDLGDYWEKETGLPIPLGGIVINRRIDPKIQSTVGKLIRRSIEFAFENPKSALDFIKSHAQEMNEEVMYKHIDLYVNDYSVSLGAKGREAVDLLFKKASELELIPTINHPVFVKG